MTPTIDWVKRYDKLRETDNMIDSINKLVEEVAASLNRQGCRWVKASERLPEKFEVLHLKIHNSPSFINVGMYSKKNNSFKVQDDNYSTATSYPIEIVEWLDESIEPCATSSEKDDVLLSFCHFLGRSGYKINGYDDSQLLTVIQQFRTQTPSPTGDRDLLPFEEGYVRKDGTGDRDCEELKKEVERLKGYLLTAYPILALHYRNKGQFLQNEYLDAIEKEIESIRPKPNL